ncbi:Fe-S cluster assembly ATPase SufC [soil metagenome]
MLISPGSYPTGDDVTKFPSGHYHYGRSANTLAAMSEAPLFEIDDLHVSADGAEILRGVSLTIRAGEVHALMGPNGSGKSTLASALLGSPDYQVTSGRIRYKGDDITDWGPDDRGKAGVFLAFQYPQTIPGVSVINFLRQALSARKGIDLSVLELRLSIMEWMERLDMDPTFADRYLNEGFSGGEKKRNEILQMAILEPEVAVLDETDSGLDIDALRVVAQGVREVQADRPDLGLLVVTHYQRLLDEIQPSHVHLLIDGRIVESGGMELVARLEADGYESWRTPVEA